MCGIFGYIGNRQAKSVILSGLTKLEYRGYDSAGLSVLFNREITTQKCIGQVSNLYNERDVAGTIGIGHTRWATHGEPSLVNAHPHQSFNGEFSVVHNGVLENYIELKNEAEASGYEFVSETDSEVIPALLQIYYNGNVLDTLIKVVNKLRGSFAVALIYKYENKIYAFKCGSPLIIGVGGNGKYVASDIYALADCATSYYSLNDNEIAVLSDDNLLYNFYGELLQMKFESLIVNDSPYDKKGYEYFMIKEIMEQPYIIETTVCEFEKRINLIKDLTFDNIYIVGCGSAYNAGLIGSHFFENNCGIKSKCIIASEYIDNCSVVSQNDLIIAISQSGETADTLASLREAKTRGAFTMSIVNI
mgnify:CR=1 FL=1